MSLAELTFILVLIVAGAAIAWVGDWVGYRLGKKRVSLFGIRPRTTAIIVGCFFGALISASTIGILALTREQYRDALFRMDDLRKERSQLLAEREALRAEVARASKEVDRYKRGAQEAESKLKELAQSIAQQRAHLTELRSRLADRQRRLEEVRRALGRSQGANKQLQAEERQLEGEIGQLQQEIGSSEGQLRKSEEQLRQTQQSLTQSEEQIRQTDRRLEDVNRRLSEAMSKYEQYRQAEALREYGAPPPVEAGHEFVRDVVDLTQPAGTVRAKIVQLLERASEEALLLGAAKGDNGRAVRLYAVKAETGRPTPEPEVPEPQAIEAVVESLMKLEEKSQVILVSALFPAWQGQQVLVGLPHRWNKLAFLEGEVVASETIDGSQSRADLYRAITILLIGSVRPEAERRGMLYQPNTKEIGRVSVDEVFDAIEELKRENRPVKVEVVVERDTWTVGPLNLDLRVGEEQ